MPVIGVLGGKSAETAAFLNELINASHEDSEISILNLENTSQECPPDIVVVLENTPNTQHYLKSLDTSSESRTFLVINPDNREIMAQLEKSPGLIVTYGFNNKVCVTASSVKDNEIQICIQRDIPTYTGKMLEQQEFGVIVDTVKKGPEIVLAALTAAMVGGLDVDVLNVLNSPALE
jgi:hypothetical protein